MNVKSLTPLVTMLLGMILAAGSAHAQEDNSVMDRLNLSSQQREQIKDLREKFRAETEKIRADIKRLLEVEKDLKSRTPVDEAALAKVLRQRADKEIELSLALTRFNERLEALLSAEQKRTLDRVREEKRGKK